MCVSTSSIPQTLRSAHTILQAVFRNQTRDSVTLTLPSQPFPTVQTKNGCVINIFFPAARPRVESVYQYRFQTRTINSVANYFCLSENYWFFKVHADVQSVNQLVLCVVYILGEKSFGAVVSPERAGMGRNKRPRVLGDHPRHFLGTLESSERLGTAWNGTLSLRDASVGGQQAGRSKSATVADQADSKKSRWKILKILGK